jgi:polar amino acid transport system substrate-binding protein
MAVALSATVHAQSIRVVTEEFPPYNFSVDGKITGFSTEVVQAVLKEAQIDGAFQSLPWARAYETAQGAENILIYSIARNPTREKLFKWVGVIAPTQYYLFSRPQRKLKLERLEDARNYQIATVNEDAGEQFLMAHGFAKGQNLQSSVKYELNYEKLKRGRVDLWIMPELVAVFLARQAGDDPSKSLARSFAINELGNDGYYMAFSIQTPDALVARVSRALATVKTNGTYDALKKKWL